jgi:hypothetical protein
VDRSSSRNSWPNPAASFSYQSKIAAISRSVRLGNLGPGSPFLVREPIQHIVGWLCPAWILAVLGWPLLGEREVRLGNRDLTRLLGDAVPKGLQLADLLHL